MTNPQTEALRKQLHPNAMALAKKRINELATSLLLQAKTLAYEEQDDVVLSNHIEEALDIIKREQKQKWVKELVSVLGGALFGAFVQGFITELSTGNTLLIVIYTILGFIGMLLVFFGTTPLTFNM